MATVGTRCKRVPCALVVVDSAFSYGVIPRLRKSVTGAARRISSLGRLEPATGEWPLFAPYNAFKSVSSVRELDESRASIAALLSPSVRFNESIDCTVLALLLPIRTAPPMARAVPTIIRIGVRFMRPSMKQTTIAGPMTAHDRPTNTSLRLRSIAFRSSSIRISSCPICSASAKPVFEQRIFGSHDDRPKGFLAQSQIS